MISLYKAVKETFNDAVSTTFLLLKIMIPISIIVKLLDEVGVVHSVGSLLTPVMSFVGLPGATGLVWATAMITNIYGGLVVFVSIVSMYPFSVAQVTVLATMILIAHSLPVEVSIARRTGVRIWFILFLRIGSAFLVGILLSGFFSITGLFQESADMFWKPEIQDLSFFGWVLNQLQNYLMIFLIIFLLLGLMNLLKRLKILDWMNRFLEPGLEHLGMSKEAAPVTMIGLTLGISYGGGIIIKEIISGKISDKDAFLSVSFLSLSHSLIEDTLLMITIGASLIGILFARLAFTIGIMLCLLWIISHLSKKQFQAIYQRPSE